jgi:glycerophosphoryl diester phosphodiesterase
MMMPDIPVYWLFGRSPFIPYGRQLIFKALANGLDGLNVHHSGVSPAFVRDAQAAGLDLYVWTVDDTRHAAILSEWGVDGITTNRPGWLRRR